MVNILFIISEISFRMISIIEFMFVFIEYLDNEKIEDNL